MSDIPIQIVDENDEPVGAASKDEAQRVGLIHRIARIMVEDEAGNVLIQRRKADKKLYPNCWDNSAAGHVDAGETYEVAARRELEEEIGIEGYDLVEVDHYRTHGSFEGRQLNRFNKLYKAVVPKDVTFRLQADEVAAVKWITRQELAELVTHKEQVTDGLIEAVEHLYKT
jgi:isopentenyl-diphosphate Delta-isomerase